ncbi:MAG: ATP-binding protein, partial [Holosporaceae bacterium]|nr:ATP-binding protein [Holosporaceae bacterium]
DEFQYWYKQINTDFAGDENGNGFVREFRDLVMQDSAIAAYKNKTSLPDCVNFILEECAYVCANLRNSALVYPTDPPASMMYCATKYKINLTNLSYKTSKHAQRNSECRKHLEAEDVLDKEIASFMKRIVSNVNFFVIDKFGNHVYKNYAYSRLSGAVNAKEYNKKAWKINMRVMKTKRKILVEERDGDTYYLTVKAPLIINDAVEGVIGLSVDTTENKRIEKLKNDLQAAEMALYNDFKVIAEQVSHDIRSPLIALFLMTKRCSCLSEKEHSLLQNAIVNIEDIANDLLKKYKEKAKSLHLTNAFEPCIFVNLNLSDVIKRIKSQYKDTNVIFNYSFDSVYNFTFIDGDPSDFQRVMHNLLNNAVEAIENKDGRVEISFAANDGNVEIYVKDNGKGMSPQMIETILNRNAVIDSSKKGGHGVGLQQAREFVYSLGGEMVINSTENVGTEIILTFAKTNTPEWFVSKFTLHKEDIVVVLDDDPSIHGVWKNRLRDYPNITIRCFVLGADAINFINSQKDKSRIFLLVDYELRNQGMNGIDVIKRCELNNDRAIVVTNAYSAIIGDLRENSFKLLIKSCIGDVSIILEERKPKKLKKVDVVFINRNKEFSQSLLGLLKEKNISAHTYREPYAFLKNLSMYPKDTKIVIDNELDIKISGIEIAKQLYGNGYANLYLLAAGMNKDDIPPFVELVENSDSIKDLL